MTIKELTPTGLEAYIDSEEFLSSEVIAITRHRAFSQINNPKVAANDILLFMAYSDEELVGYLGVLADSIHLNGEEHKVGWLSCIWTSEKMRGKGVAKQLLSAALKSWNNKILATEFTDAAKALYDRSGEFMDLTILCGRRGYLRFNLHELLPPKGFPNMLAGTLAVSDFAMNIFNTARLLFWKATIDIGHLDLEYIDEIDQETADLIQERNSAELTARNTEELNWINNYPWVLSAPENDPDAERYQFTSSESVFETLNIKLKNKGGELIAFVMLVIRGKNLKIPYCYFNEEHTSEILKVICNLMFERGLNMVTTYNSAISNYFQKHRSPFIFSKEMKRSYLITKKLGQYLADESSIKIQDGSGDCAFT